MSLIRNLETEETEQLRLFEIEEKPSATDTDRDRSSFNDPAFAKNKTLPMHRWIPWIAGFSREFVGGVLDGYLDGKGTVLDPFSGVGTTLLESILRGHNAVGFEINPYAALACRTKVNAHRVSVKAFYCEIYRFKEFYSERAGVNYTPKSRPPKGFKTRAEFYSPQVLHKVLVLQDFIESMEDTGLQDLFRLAFASTMVRYSNYSYEPSLGRRVSAGKEEIQDFPVVQTILDKLAEMAEDITWFRKRLPHIRPTAQIFNDSFFKYQTYSDRESVDLIVTSPPRI